MIEINTKENIRYLREILQKEQKVAVFIGAGTSDFLGIKGWDSVLEEMKKEFKAENIDVQKSIEEDGYAETATMIYETKNDMNLYKAFMSKQFIPKKAYHYSLHVKLINLFDTFLTTNFDTCLESAFDDLNNHLLKLKYLKRNYITRKLPEFEYAEILTAPTLIYLHGNNENEKYIFKKDEYELHYPSCFSKNGYSPLENFLKQIFEEFYLVFIGFSFNDRDFVKFYKKCRIEAQKFYQDFKRIHGTERNPKPEFPKHFIVMSQKEIIPKISKNKVEKVFGTDNAWRNYFLDSSLEELEFKDNADELISGDIEGDTDKDRNKRKKYLLDKFSSSRFFLIKKAYIQPITFESSEYIEIENILKSLGEAETTLSNNINEAANA